MDCHKRHYDFVVTEMVLKTTKKPFECVMWGSLDNTTGKRLYCAIVDSLLHNTMAFRFVI
jgi:hypothetical protein